MLLAARSTIVCTQAASAASDATITAELTNRVGVHDPELEPEPIEHLLLPLHAQARRAHDEHRAGTMAEQKFLHDQTSLDRLPETDIVCDEQVRPGHGKRSDDRVELVVLDRDAGPEWSLERSGVCGGHRTPTDGIEKRVEALRCVEPPGHRPRKLLMRDDLRPSLDLPDDGQLVAESVVL